MNRSHPSHRSFRAVLTAAGIAAALLAAVFTARAIPQPGALAPPFTLGLIANGHGSITLSNFKGRGVYLNFFASWCVPCKAEVPSIARLSKAYAKKGVVVIGVDELESPEAARGFIAHYKLPYAVGIDDSGSMGASYGLIGLPLHVFIDPNGKVVARRSGEMSANQIRADLDRITRK